MRFSTPAWRELSSEPFTPDAVMSALAARQHGVVSLAQLLAAGLNHEAIRRRVRQGRLHRIHRGVYAVGHPGLSFEGRCMAAVLACGEGSAVSHLTAAHLWKVSRWLAVPIAVATFSQRRPKGVRTHRVTRLDKRDIAHCHGIPVTTIPRVLIDLSDTMTPHQLAYVIHEAAFRDRFDLDATRAAITRANGRRNLGRLERAIELHLSGSAGTRSAKEDAFLARLPGAQREAALVNMRVAGFEVDVHWPDSDVVVEIDGPGHGRPATRREDARRDEILEAAGYEVRRVQTRRLD